MENFIVIKKLGTGSFGTVLKVKRIEDGQIYACKKVNIGGLDSKEQKNALNEIRILASLEHPQIISYKEAFYEESTKSLCIIMEFAEGGDLQQLIDTKNVIKTANHLYANVFLTRDGNVKLGDLNVSKVNHGGLMFTQTGTPYYASPEVWKDKPYDSKSDIWSLGCVLYEMCALMPPFTARDMKGLYSKVIKGEYSRIPDRYSDHLANIIDMCLRVVPSKRLSAAQLLRTKEIVLHLRENKIEEKGENKINLLDTIKLPSNFSLIKDRLPTAKYETDKEEIKINITSHKYRGLSARGRNDESSLFSRKLLNRDNSLSLLKESQSKPLSGGNIRVSKVNSKKFVSLLPPKSNRPAHYKKDSDYSIILPPIQRPAGLPSIGFDYRLRQRSETRGSSRASQNNDYSNPITNRQNYGYRRRADIASRQKLQQNLINKAFGLPITPINRMP